MDIREQIQVLRREGYNQELAEAKLCQDIVLKAISDSSLNRNVTVKGGVVMRGITADVRRATQDLDIDFIRYSLSDEAIQAFLDKINTLDGLSIRQIGTPETLRQQDYQGKRVYVEISDKTGFRISSKIDLGVHNRLDIEQEEFCFDVCFSEDGASLLINSKEQMFTEKLRSLLRFGEFSTRYKDIFDMYYLSGLLDREKLRVCVEEYIFSDPIMRENSFDDICARVSRVFASRSYRANIASSKKNWLGVSIDEVLDQLLDYLQALSPSMVGV